MSQYDNLMEDELLQALQPDIANGSIQIIEDDQKYANLISEHFPFVGNKISWSKVPSHVTAQLDWQKGFSQAADSIMKLEYVDTVLSFFDNVMKITKTPSAADLVVLGDSYMETALRLSSQVLRKHLFDVIELPQHTYIMSLDVSWCLAYTTEGYMDFGFAPN